MIRFHVEHLTRYRYQHDVGLNHGEARLLPRDTPDQIRAEIARLCRKLGRGGGFIIGPTKPIMPDVPTENAVACVEAILGQAKG